MRKKNSFIETLKPAKKFPLLLPNTEYGNTGMSGPNEKVGQEGNKEFQGGPEDTLMTENLPNTKSFNLPRSSRYKDFVDSSKLPNTSEIDELVEKLKRNELIGGGTNELEDSRIEHPPQISVTALKNRLPKKIRVHQNRELTIIWREIEEKQLDEKEELIY